MVKAGKEGGLAFLADTLFFTSGTVFNITGDTSFSGFIDGEVLLTVVAGGGVSATETVINAGEA